MLYLEIYEETGNCQRATEDDAKLGGDEISRKCLLVCQEMWSREKEFQHWSTNHKDLDLCTFRMSIV